MTTTEAEFDQLRRDMQRLRADLNALGATMSRTARSAAYETGGRMCTAARDALRAAGTKEHLSRVTEEHSLAAVFVGFGIGVLLDIHLFFSVRSAEPLTTGVTGQRGSRHTHLARRGITATVAQVQSRGRPIAETLQQHAQEIGAGILVIGGFAHSRMRDFVLGGGHK